MRCGNTPFLPPGSGGVHLFDPIRTPSSSSTNLEKSRNSYPYVAVFPYRRITQSGALVTAMAGDVAVLASDLPGFRETLEHEVSAWLVPPDEPGALVEGLERLCASPSLRERLAAGARSTVEEELSWAVARRVTAECYARARAEVRG